MYKADAEKVQRLNTRSKGGYFKKLPGNLNSMAYKKEKHDEGERWG